MGMFTNCSGPCFLCACSGGCWAGNGDDDFSPASTATLLSIAITGRFSGLFECKVLEKSELYRVKKELSKVKICPDDVNKALSFIKNQLLNPDKFEQEYPKFKTIEIDGVKRPAYDGCDFRTNYYWWLKGGD